MEEALQLHPEISVKIPIYRGNVDDIKENLPKYPPTNYGKDLSYRLGLTRDISPDISGDL